jgi:hypothetical protein
MSKIQVLLNKPQTDFISLPHKFRGFVGGFGSGKTWVGCTSLGRHFTEFPRVNAGYFAPSYPQIRDIFYPTIDEALFPFGFNTKTRTGDKEVDVYRGRKYYGTTICRSMERPETIVGFKIGRALVDEIDVMKTDKARAAWRKIIARLRHNAPGLQNGIDVTTTPEGFKFVHNQFIELARDKPEVAGMYGIVQASTYDNEINLPDDYIPSLLASYPEQLIDAYINGQFVNLKTGTVYKAYNRESNRSSETIKQGEPLFIGMDFNVGKMSAIVHVKRSGDPHAVDEITGAYDTPDMVRRIQEKYWKIDKGERVKTCGIAIYPDASGNSRKSNDASTSDLQILRDGGFQVVVGSVNPAVKDRVNAMNGLFCNAIGVRRYRVNPDTCPVYAGSLEQQAWNDQGEPDKTSGHDHTNDAGGYFIAQDYPIKRRIAETRDF